MTALYRRECRNGFDKPISLGQVVRMTFGGLGSTIHQISGDIERWAYQGDDQFKSTFNWRELFLRSLRLYFAPLTGAFKGIRDEYRRIAQEDASSDDKGREPDTAKRS